MNVFGNKKTQKEYKDWFIENISRSRDFERKHNNIKNLLREQKPKEAFILTNSLISDLIKEKHNTSNIGYALERLIKENSRTSVRENFFDLMYKELKPVFRTGEPKPKRIKESTVEEIKKEFHTEKRYYSINKQNERVEAIEQIAINRGKPQNRLVDIKTGKYLKSTDSFKKELAKRLKNAESKHNN